MEAGQCTSADVCLVCCFMFFAQVVLAPSNKWWLKLSSVCLSSFFCLLVHPSKTNASNSQKKIGQLGKKPFLFGHVNLTGTICMIVLEFASKICTW